MHFFNVTGSCDPARHYMIPAEGRLPGAEALIAKGAYFVVHAPRQTGKTTTMKALALHLTAEGRYAALRFSCQGRVGLPGRRSCAAEKTVWSEIEEFARATLPEALRPPTRTEADTGKFIKTQLTRWAEACPRPIVLFIDEIDAIGGLEREVDPPARSGPASTAASAAYPWTVILCGLRDVRDYWRRERRGPAAAGHVEPVQHQGRLAPPRQLRRGRDPRALRPAHRRDRPGVHREGARARVDADPGPAVALQRAGPRGGRGDRGPPRRAHPGRAHERRQGAPDPGPRHPPGLAPRPAPGEARAPHPRAHPGGDAEEEPHVRRRDSPST